VYKVTQDHAGDRLQVVLQDDVAKSQAILTPSRGGMLTGLQLQGREYLYGDPENLLSDERPRCAMPVLFPICGPLPNDTFTWNQKRYTMGIHGVAHLLPWELVATSAADGAEAVLQLAANEKSLTAFPFAFELTFRYRLQGRRLWVRQAYANTGTEAMPFVYGFHPYFIVENAAAAQMDLKMSAARYFGPASPIPAERPMLDSLLSLPAQGPEGGIFCQGVRSPVVMTQGSRQITMGFDSSFSTVVIWSNRYDKYLCVEPWSGTAADVSAGTALQLLPGETWHAECWIEMG